MSKQRNSKLKATKRAAFLAALSEGVTIREAAGAANLPVSTLYGWRRVDAEFASAWDDAYAAGADTLAAEAQRRAVKGTNKPVFYLGKPVGHITEYSDTLLIF